jgi:hypothetical protein
MTRAVGRITFAPCAPAARGFSGELYTDAPPAFPEIQFEGGRMNHHADPKSLSVHPAAHAVPDLPPRQYAALKSSIERLGIRHPLLADAEGRVIDGRNRLKIALEIGLEIVPVVTVDGTDAATLACESAVARRNLTDSGRVLVLYMAHPALAGGGVREASRANLKKGASPPNVNNSQSGESKKFATFATLAERYGVAREYFSTLAEMEAKCAGNSSLWQWVQNQILREEYSIPRVNAGLGSKASPHTKKRSDPRYESLVRPAAVTLGNAFAKWGSFSSADAGEALRSLIEPWKRMPDAVRALTKETILEHWPEHEKAELSALLKRAGAKSGRHS